MKWILLAVVLVIVFTIPYRSVIDKGCHIFFPAITITNMDGSFSRLSFDGDHMLYVEGCGALEIGDNLHIDF